MPFEVVQSNPGNGLTVSFAGGAAPSDGNLLVVSVAVGGGQISGVTGFTRLSPSSAPGSLAKYAKTSVASETSWTITLSISGPVVWYVEELAGADLAFPVDVTVTANAATLVSATTGLTSSYDAIADALHASYNATGGVAATLGSHTNGFEEVVEVATNDGTKAIVMSLSRKAVHTIDTQQCTATASGTTPTSSVSHVVVLSAEGARRAADVVWQAGAEFGSTTGLTGTGTSQPYLSGATAGVTVVAGAARTGNFGFRITAAASVVNFHANNYLLDFRQIGRASIKLRTALPTADAELARFGQFVLRFRVATGKITVQHINGGTERESDAAVVADTWISVDWRVDQTGAAHTCDWQVTYDDGTEPVPQTQASLGGQSALLCVMYFGSVNSQTLNMDVDDIVASFTAGHHPLGDIRIYPLKVDPAGTPTISGTTANFQTFTAGGTGAAWNATTARGAVDEIPPTIGGAADGVMQITSAASDYVEFPLETLDLTTVPGSVRGIRACVCGWAGSATTATIGVFAYDGITEHFLVGGASQVDPNWDNTGEFWACGMLRGQTAARQIWTQARLDALVLRMGRSSDATPDIGINGFVFEVAVRKIASTPLFGDLATTVLDPDSAGVQTITVNAPTDYDIDLEYEEAGSPTTVPVVGGTSHTETIQAADAPAINRITVYWAPEPDPAA